MRIIIVVIFVIVGAYVGTNIINGFTDVVNNVLIPDLMGLF